VFEMHMPLPYLLDISITSFRWRCYRYFSISVWWWFSFSILV